MALGKQAEREPAAGPSWPAGCPSFPELYREYVALKNSAQGGDAGSEIGHNAGSELAYSDEEDWNHA
jgi:hypothetical protein